MDGEAGREGERERERERERDKESRTERQRQTQRHRHKHNVEETFGFGGRIGDTKRLLGLVLRVLGKTASRLVL